MCWINNTRRLLKTLACSVLSFCAVSQTPKLVVWITVDQMRYEMLHRYKHRWTTNGIKRFTDSGFVFNNAHYNYVPTYTGPGHASLFTGTTPRVHGIVGNHWYSRSKAKMVYCTNDTVLKNQPSPQHLQSSTIGDELRLSNSNNSKVIAVSLKDRSAIFPAGRHGNAAYWFDEHHMQFITSAWYMQSLPKWVNTFNKNLNIYDRVKKGWKPYYALSTYTASTPDTMSFEASPTGSARAVFPYEYLKTDAPGTWIKGSPQGNALVTDFAMEAINAEALGTDSYCDLLSISYSSTDIIGHATGPRSVETEDTYIRLNIEFEKLFSFLDARIGAEHYMVILSADHGAAEVPKFLIDQNIPAGLLTDDNVLQHLKRYCQINFKDSTLVEHVCNHNIYLKSEVSSNVPKIQLINSLRFALTQLQGIAQVFNADEIIQATGADGSSIMQIHNGFMPEHSGDLVYTLKPQWMDHESKGTTHGSGYNYDTHVPLLFVGFGISKGHSFEHVNITQIASTLAELLHICKPSGCTALPLNALLR
ncbi:MAG: alkaline phosphatase family protein [Bacteroidia bacterium]